MPSAASAPHAFARERFPLWGGHAVVATSEGAGLPAALNEVKRTVAAFDVACSSFRDDSELALLNASPDEDVVVSSLLLSAIREALRAARLTDGAVDPTVGQTLMAHGINPPSREREFVIAPVRGYRVVKLDDAANRVRIPAGVELDLGATSKALAADIAAEAAASAAGCGVLVGLCGDIAVAGACPERGWTIRVTEDHRDADAPGQTLAIRSGGLATSSTTVRRSGDIHHLIDPATGRPASGPWIAVSATADSCLDANIATTAAIVFGARAPEWLELHRVPARLVGNDGSVCYTAGWPVQGDEL